MTDALAEVKLLLGIGNRVCFVTGLKRKIFCEAGGTQVADLIQVKGKGDPLTGRFAR